MEGWHVKYKILIIKTIFIALLLDKFNIKCILKEKISKEKINREILNTKRVMS